jgi:DNA-directed RNA polymerase subunit RPC12/RpoP
MAKTNDGRVCSVCNQEYQFWFTIPTNFTNTRKIEVIDVTKEKENNIPQAKILHSRDSKITLEVRCPHCRQDDTFNYDIN